MSPLLIIFALVVAGAASAEEREVDVRVDVYDTVRERDRSATRLRDLIEKIKKDGPIGLKENIFREFHGRVREFVALHKDKHDENVLRGYLIKTDKKTSDVPQVEERLRPLMDDLRTERYVAFTPLAAKFIRPSMFMKPVKGIRHSHYPDINLDKDIPVVFLVPRRDVDEAKLKELRPKAKYEIDREGVHKIRLAGHEKLDEKEKKDIKETVKLSMEADEKKENIEESEMKPKTIAKRSEEPKMEKKEEKKEELKEKKEDLKEKKEKPEKDEKEVEESKGKSKRENKSDEKPKEKSEERKSRMLHTIRKEVTEKKTKTTELRNDPTVALTQPMAVRYATPVAMPYATPVAMPYAYRYAYPSSIRTIAAMSPVVARYSYPTAYAGTVRYW